MNKVGYSQIKIEKLNAVCKRVRLQIHAGNGIWKDRAKGVYFSFPLKGGGNLVKWTWIEDKVINTFTEDELVAKVLDSLRLQ